MQEESVVNNNNNNKICSISELNKNPQLQREALMLLLNQYFVLLTRATDKVRVGFWKNEDIKDYIKRSFG